MSKTYAGKPGTGLDGPGPAPMVSGLPGVTGPEPFGKKRRARRRWLAWAAVAAVAALALAYLTGAIGRQEAGTTGEPVAGPPPVVSATGPVVPEKRAKLSFTTSGRVRSLSVKPGDQVAQGQMLAQLDPASVQSSAFGASSPPSPGASELYITAPFAGTVGLVPVNEWETVTPGMPVVVLGDLRTLRVEIEDLSEAEVGRLEPGQSADVSFEAFPGLTVPARLARISPMNNAKGGGVNYDVVVEFTESPLPSLRWGMTAHVDIHVDGTR